LLRVSKGIYNAKNENTLSVQKKIQENR